MMLETELVWLRTEVAKLLSEQPSRAKIFKETRGRQAGITHSILRKIDKPLSEAYAVNIRNQHR